MDKWKEHPQRSESKKRSASTRRVATSVQTESLLWYNASGKMIGLCLIMEDWKAMTDGS
jgi:hypothetical protein